MSGLKSAEELEALKAAGNALFKARDYAGAADKYGEALGGPEATGNGMAVGIGTSLLLNRAACRLELADRMSGISPASVEAEAKLDHYAAASRDAEEAVKMSRMLGGPSHAKALFRLGRAGLGVSTGRAQLLQMMQQHDKIDAAELLEMRRAVAKNLEMTAMHLRSALAIQPADKLVTASLRAAEALQAELALVGAPPKTQAPVAAPRPEAFAAGVLFQPGAQWMENRVALEIPLMPRKAAEVRLSQSVTMTRSSLPAELLLPVYLSKQENDNNRGELAIWIHFSDHLGADVLAERCSRLGMDPECEGGAGEAWGNLSIPVQGPDVEAPDEFMMNFQFFRNNNDYSSGVPAALEAAGVVASVRTSGQTQFGEAFRIYRALF